MSMMGLKVSPFKHFPQLEDIINLKCNSQHGHKMSGCCEHDKDMPHLMKSKYAWHKVENPGDVYDRAKRVHESARDQPANHPSRQDREHLSDGADAQPAHYQINPCVQPARCPDIKHFHNNSHERQRPDDT